MNLSETQSISMPTMHNVSAVGLHTGWRHDCSIAF